MIRVSDIEKIEDRRREVRKEIYTKLYEQFSRKIRQSVDFGQNQVFLTVPGYLLGYATFNRAHAATYLRRQLVRAQFEVSTVDAYTFYVRWGRKSTAKQLEPSVRGASAPAPDTSDDFPTLVNLKKAANKHRNNFQGPH